MKKLPYLAALAVASVSMPANATLFDVSFSGFVVGTQDRFNCIGPTQCEALFGGNTGFYNDFGLPFETAISGNFGRAEIGEGQSFTFSIGRGRDFPAITGTVTNNMGFLTGTNLTYFFDTCSTGAALTGPCSQFRASAPTFAAIGGVPEPTTWAMMLIGFAAIGYSMRSRRKPPLHA